LNPLFPKKSLSLVVKELRVRVRIWVRVKVMG